MPSPLIPGAVYLEHGKPVIILAVWKGPGPRNVLIRRADGSRAVRPFRGLRRLERRVTTGDEAADG